ncbi:MAG: cyclophilin family peptidyl-prolyl cis-trans isomerase [Flavobacterium sp.]|jgi:cyclophilin family peptidyl-prolyl cis-trans isomerase
MIERLISVTFSVYLFSCNQIFASELILVRIETNLGGIDVQLDGKKAPLTAENFLKHVDAGHYENVIFHRVIEGLIIQSGGYKEDLVDIESEDALYNEADNGLQNVMGTIAMARQFEIDSAGRQFFINTEDNPHLDFNEKSCTRKDEKKHLKTIERGLNKPLTCASFGYAVFGRVVSGMAIVRLIESSPTEEKGDFNDLPIKPIIIKSIKRMIPTRKSDV